MQTTNIESLLELNRNSVNLLCNRLGLDRMPKKKLTKN